MGGGLEDYSSTCRVLGWAHKDKQYYAKCADILRLKESLKILWHFSS